MRSIPYGYRFENGTGVICQDEAERVKKAFELYLYGESLRTIGSKVGINRAHMGISYILADDRYKGTDLYPKIIDEELFESVASKRKERKKAHKRSAYSSDRPKAITEFTLDVKGDDCKDPFQQAQYIYSLIKGKE